MRVFSKIANGLGIVFLIAGLAFILISFESTFSRIDEEPEDVAILVFLVVHICLSVAVSLANIREARRLSFKRLTLFSNVFVLAITLSLLIGTLLIHDPDWPLRVIWIIPYAAHLLFRLQLGSAPNSIGPDPPALR